MLNFNRSAATGSVNTASPADSGPRSVIPSRIGIISAPSWPRSAGFLINSPTIPHTVIALPSEEFQVAVRFPPRYVARIFDPFHALQPHEFARQVLAERSAQNRIRFERVDRRSEILRQDRDPLLDDLLGRQ